MSQANRSSRIPALSAIIALTLATALPADITLIGTAGFPGDASDRSGLTGRLEGNIPHNRLGGISAIEHVGGNRYLLQPDRGPADGVTSWACRFDAVEITVDPGQMPVVKASFVATTLLRDEQGRQLTGSTKAFDAHDATCDLRFDPEGLRRSRDGRLFVSDEYGPAVCEFTAAGMRKARLPVPSRFLIAHRAATPEEENLRNSCGRQANGGLEGLAITPGGDRLYAAMQRPLIQDSRPEGAKRVGTNTRLIEFTLSTAATRELLYPLDDTANGISEILAVNEHEFLVLERDGRAGAEAITKKIFRIDIADATDVGDREILPPDGMPSGVTPVRKKLFLDLLDPRFGLAGPNSPEKVEGLAFGPDLPDGRRLLLVAIDNDFVAERPVLLHAFAVDRIELPVFGWDHFARTD